MKFCENCDNMLTLKINDTVQNSDGDGEENVSTSAASNTKSSCKLMYICRRCNEEYESEKSDSCVFNINFNLDNIKKNSFINPFIYDDITNPRAEGIKCPNANCPEAKPEIVYIQYDKENIKYIYVCLSCHKKGIEPHIW